MRRNLVTFLLLFLPWLARADGLPDFTELVEREAASVVNISTTQTLKAGDGGGDEGMQEFFRRYGIPVPPGGGMPHGGPGGGEAHSLGSGFVISADGYILTNSHVVAGADEIVVAFSDKRELKAKVIGSDSKTDVALIKVEASGLKPVATGNVDRLKVGEWVVAIGSPFGFEATVTKGIVSAKGRSLPQEALVPFIQTDVPINPGNSGGPLFNLKGEVVGINSQIYSRTGGFMGLSFAIPIDVALDVSRQLRDTGKVTRGWLGVVIQDVTHDIADSFGLPTASGALIASVERGGPADSGGLQASDIITRFDGHPINAREDLPRAVGATRPGSKVKVTVWRKGASRELDVAIGEMPGDDPGKGGTPGKLGADKPSGRIGLALGNLKDEQRKELDLKGGVLVQEVSGAAARAGIEVGDVILSLNNSDVASVDEFDRVLAANGDKKVLALLVRRGDNSRFITLKKDNNAG